MIDYDTGTWGIGYLCHTTGSVFNKSLVVATPNCILAMVLHILTQHSFNGDWVGMDIEDEDRKELGMQLGYGGVTTVLGILLVFRTQQAYRRWWEGATLLLTVRGEWFNAYSNLLAFSTRDPAKRTEVETFQHLLMRLMSLLYCSALQQLSTLEHSEFEVIDLSGLDSSAMTWLQETHDRCEVLVAWIQRITVDAHNSSILAIPPPILSRVFQELSRGIVNFSNVRKIAEIPFPFPYVQTLTVLLGVHYVLTPVLMAVLCKSYWWAGIISFLPTTALWSLYYVAQEIECPFGDDANDLPLVDWQQNFNQNLIALIMAESQQAPLFEFNQDRHWKMHVANLEDGVTFEQVTRKSSSDMTSRDVSSTKSSQVRFKDSINQDQPEPLPTLREDAGVLLDNMKASVPGEPPDRPSANKDRRLGSQTSNEGFAPRGSGLDPIASTNMTAGNMGAENRRSSPSSRASSRISMHAGLAPSRPMKVVGGRKSYAAEPTASTSSQEQKQRWIPKISFLSGGNSDGALTTTGSTGSKGSQTIEKSGSALSLSKSYTHEPSFGSIDSSSDAMTAREQTVAREPPSELTANKEHKIDTDPMSREFSHEPAAGTSATKRLPDKCHAEV